MRYLRFAVLTASCVLAQPGHALDLRQVLDQVWLRAPEAQRLDARQTEVSAQAVAARSWVPEPPSVTVGAISDAATDDRGQSEWEAELSVPLWLPGQRAASGNVAALQANALEAERRALRWKLAGELRQAIWNAASREAELATVQKRLNAAQALEADVAKRVRAGDLARTDLLLAQNETATAHQALIAAQNELAQARLVYTTLTGLPELPTQFTENLEPTSSERADHPAIAGTAQAVALAQAQLALVQQSRRDAPELGLVARREREDRDADYSESVGLRVRVPFGTDARNAPLQAAAQSELTQASSEYEQIRRHTELNIAQARQALENAKILLALSEKQAQQTQENLNLSTKAFALGELDLLDLIRIRAQAQEASLAYSQAQIALSRATAELNQALGVVP